MQACRLKGAKPPLRRRNKVKARKPLVECLYHEFESYYLTYRCPYAPECPRRVFKFALATVYRRYKRHLSLPEFLSLIYAMLGIPVDDPKFHGMFQTFDP